MNFIAKSIFKKVALVLAGVTAITAAGFGVKALVDYTKDDLKTISPKFEVGNLGSDGKFVDDKSTLYTKEAFEAEGLQIKLDFDSQINYQIFYYDDLDNFVESTAVLSTAYSETVHDGYARIVITPTDDEDEKISLVERVKYPGQMEIKVNKEQNVQYYNVLNRRLKVVDNVSMLRFVNFSIAINDDGSYIFKSSDKATSTALDLLQVGKYSSINFNIPTEWNEENCDYHFYLYTFKLVDGKIIVNTFASSITNYSFLDDDEYIVVCFSSVGNGKPGTDISSKLSSLNNCITLSK